MGSHQRAVPKKIVLRLSVDCVSIFAKQATRLSGIPAVELGRFGCTKISDPYEIPPEIIDQLVFGP